MATARNSPRRKTSSLSPSRPMRSPNWRASSTAGAFPGPTDSKPSVSATSTSSGPIKMRNRSIRQRSPPSSPSYGGGVPLEIHATGSRVGTLLLLVGSCRGTSRWPIAPGVASMIFWFGKREELERARGSRRPRQKRVLRRKKPSPANPMPSKTNELGSGTTTMLLLGAVVSSTLLHEPSLQLKSVPLVRNA